MPQLGRPPFLRGRDVGAAWPVGHASSLNRAKPSDHFVTGVWPSLRPFATLAGRDAGCRAGLRWVSCPQQQPARRRFLVEHTHARYLPRARARCVALPHVRAGSRG
jgi:hypothetical protein